MRGGVACAVQPDREGEREREMDTGRSTQGNKTLKAAEIFMVR